MSVTATEGDPYAERTTLLREIRERVADDVHDLIVERQELGSQGELVQTIQRVGAIAKRIVEAQGRQLQAQEHGMPVSRAIADERAARELLRATVMSLSNVSASWVVAMDFETRKGEVDL